MAGLFGGLFDLNHDGKMNAFERAAEFSFLSEMLRKETDGGREALEEAGLDPDDYDFR